MKNWPKVELTGDAFVIPRMCPNCMAEGNVELRYGHMKSSLGSSKTYIQSFYYCAPCEAMFRDQDGVKELRLKQALPLIFGGMIALSGLLSGAWIMFLIAAALTTWPIVWMNKRYRRKHPLPPLPPNALGRKLAAYYAGPGAGFWSKKKLYTAARQEWLNLLIAHNPDAVTDDEYGAATGRHKPQTARPF